MEKLLRFVLAVLCFLSVCANATTIDFNDHQIGIITDGNYYDDVYAWDYAYVSITGGEIGWFLFSHDYSHINLTGGVLTAVDAFNNSIVEISGGTVRGANIQDSSIMYLSGGNILDATFAIFGDAVLHVYGKDFLYTPGGGYGFGWLSGHWANGSEFSIRFRNLPESFPPESSVILHIIPEPWTIGLVGFGFLIMRRKIKIPHK